MSKAPRSHLARLAAGGAAHDLVTHRGGSIVAGAAGRDEMAAFVHVSPRAMPLPVLIAIPHAGRAYPGEVLAEMRDPARSQLRLEDRHVDAVGVELARETGTGLMIARAPRAMLDLNRSADDIDWDMVIPASKGEERPNPRQQGSNSRARSGLGLVPRRLPGFGEIWRSRLPSEELGRRVDQIHRPYHTFLERELRRIRDAWGAALLIDLHSMPPLRRPSGEERAPQIVLGDRYGASCHASLAARAFRYLDQHGSVAAHNRPYSGGYVLDRHANPARGIHGVQIELCRSTYLEASLSEPTGAVKPLARMLAGLVRELGAETARLGSGGELAQAAE